MPSKHGQDNIADSATFTFTETVPTNKSYRNIFFSATCEGKGKITFKKNSRTLGVFFTSIEDPQVEFFMQPNQSANFDDNLEASILNQSGGVADVSAVIQFND